MTSKATKAARKAAAAQTQTAVKTDVPTTAPPAEQPKETPKVATKRVGTVKVLKTDAKFGGARLAWYNKLKEFDGKPIADYEETCDQTPPSLPKSGKKEKPSGWIGYFTRTGILQVIPPAAK